MKILVALIPGLLFGFGLAASGMTNTEKVQGFLDIFGAWDPDLAYVMGSAVVTAAIGYRVLFANASKPLLDLKFRLPTSTDIDGKLLIGAAVFGTGWGLFGYCPGPAIASISYGSTVTLIFVLAMLAGMAAASKVP